MPEHETDILRVRTWDEYVGQEQLKTNLALRIRAAVKANRMLDPVFLSAAPGYGKTSLAGIIAHRLGAHYWSLKMTPSMNLRDLELVLTAAEPCTVVLLDEIHSASDAVQEALLPVVEEGYIQNKAGKRSFLEDVTIIAATTERHRVLAPLVDRFKIAPHFVDYTDEELAQIITTMAARIEVPIDRDLAIELAPAAAFTPRLAGVIVLAIRDLIEVGEPVTKQSVLSLAEVDEDGCSPAHLDYLRAIDQLGGQSGSRNLCSLLQISLPQLENLERLPIRRQMVLLEPSGRKITGLGMRKIGVADHLISRSS